MKYKIPKIFFTYFESGASKANQEDILAIGLGKLEDEICLVEELIFPFQNGADGCVEDKGMFFSYQIVHNNIYP